MSTTQVDIPRPEGWDDATYEQLVHLVTFVRDLEALGGSEGILALVTQPAPAHVAALSGAAATDIDLNWANGTSFSGKIWPDGLTVNVELNTEDGHHAKFSFRSPAALLLFGSTKDIRGKLGFNDWSSLKAGANKITVNTRSGQGPIVVDGTTQGEFAIEIPPIAPSVSVSFSFSWDW